MELTLLAVYTVDNLPYQHLICVRKSFFIYDDCHVVDYNSIFVPNEKCDYMYRFLGFDAL